MKKLIILFILSFYSVTAFSKTIEAKYKVTYGSLLDLGIATSTLEINENRYKIKIEAKTTGMAKYLSNNRVEIYESYGTIENNKFIPQKHIKTKKDDLSSRVKTYTFDYEKQKVFVHTIRSGIKAIFNDSFQREEISFKRESNSTLKYFAQDDLLSLFFNIKDKIKTYEAGKEYKLKAVGANKTKGVINIAMPNVEKRKELNEYLKTDDKIKFTAYINQKIFQSKRGELLLALNEHGFCSYSVLRDVILFGDIVGKMIDFKIKG